MTRKVAGDMASPLADVYRAIDECKLEAKAFVCLLRERFSDMCLEWRNTEHMLEGLIRELRERGVLGPPDEPLESTGVSTETDNRASGRTGSVRSRSGKFDSGFKSQPKKFSMTEQESH